MIRPLVLAGLLLIATVVPYVPGRAAQATDPANGINDFYLLLLETMKQAKVLGPKGRYEKLAPIILKTFDVAGMMHIAAGTAWEKASPHQQAALVDGFSRMIAAQYANRFDDFNGEKFEVLPAVGQPPSDMLIMTTITQNDARKIALSYLMHNTPKGWRVADVYLDGTISQLAMKRAEFQSILKSGGPDALVAALNQKADNLLAGV
jgi:phospholipid transport system substrate-binding protein